MGLEDSDRVREVTQFVRRLIVCHCGQKVWDDESLLDALAKTDSNA
jgi:hypothetical protein